MSAQDDTVIEQLASALYGKRPKLASGGGKKRRSAPTHPDGESHGDEESRRSVNGTLRPPDGVVDRSGAAATKLTLDGLGTTDDSPCVINTGGEPCASKEVIAGLAEFVKEADSATLATEADTYADSTADNAKTAKELGGGDSNLPTSDSRAARVMVEAAEMLHCDSEACVLKHPAVQAVVGKSAARRDLNTLFKQDGPSDSTALLSNVDIDNCLARWAAMKPEMWAAIVIENPEAHGKTLPIADPRFYHCPFAMMDFKEYAEDYTFAQVDVGALLTSNYRTFACVLNTDMSTGPGKHWVTVFVDNRSAPATIEYFNSAGNPPPRAVLEWASEVIGQFARHGVEARLEPVTSVRHQSSRTECGVYSLYYVRERLEGAPLSFFKTHWVTDDAMIEFRRHLFK